MRNAILFLTLLTILSCNRTNDSGHEKAPRHHQSAVPVEQGPTKVPENATPPHHIQNLPIPSLVIFAGDTVPLEKDHVREDL
jgi:hypothetical protein